MGTEDSDEATAKVQMYLDTLADCASQSDSASSTKAAIVAKEIENMAIISESNQIMLGSRDGALLRSLFSLLPSANDCVEEGELGLQSAAADLVTRSAAILWALVRLCRRTLSKDSSCQQNLASVEAHCDQIVKTMRTYIAHEEVMLPSCWLCMVMASDSTERQALLAGAGATDAVVKVMMRHAANVPVAEFSCRAARNLAIDDDITAKLVEDKVNEALVHMFTETNNSHKDAAVLEACMWTTVNLSCDDRVAPLMGAAGICDVLVEAGKFILCIESAAEAWCSCVRNLSTSSAYNYNRFASTSVCELLIQCMNRYKEVKDIAEVALWATANLACDDELAKRLVSAGIIQEISEVNEKLHGICEATEQQPDIAFGPIAESTLWALRNIAAAGTEGQEALSRHGAADVMLDYLVRYRAREGMVEMAIGCLTNFISEHVDNKLLLGQGTSHGKQALPRICEIIREHRAVPETLMYGMRLIAVAAKACPENAEALRSAPCLAQEIAARCVYEHRGDAHLFQYSCEILFHVCYTTAEKRQELADNKLLDPTNTRSLLPWGTFAQMTGLWGLDSLAQEHGIDTTPPPVSQQEEEQAGNAGTDDGNDGAEGLTANEIDLSGIDLRALLAKAEAAEGGVGVSSDVSGDENKA